MVDAVSLTDPEARNEAYRFALELEEGAKAVGTEQSSQMLVRAADIYRLSLGDHHKASELLRSALQHDPQCRSAIVRLMELASRESDWSKLADLLDTALSLVTRPEQRASILAKRGDVLGLRLGRIAEARGLYREAARNASSAPRLRDAAQQAAETIDRSLTKNRQTGEAAGRLSWPEVVPSDIVVELDLRVRSASDSVSELAIQLFNKATEHLDRKENAEARSMIDSGLKLDPESEQGRSLLKNLLRAEGRYHELVDALIQFGERSRSAGRKLAAFRDAARISAGPLSQLSRAMELYQLALECQQPTDEQTLAEAISRGIRQGILDVAKQLLPANTADQRAYLIRELVQGAEVVGDERSVQEYRAAAFYDDPTSQVNFTAAIGVLRSQKDESGLCRALDRRARVTTDVEEKRSLYYELRSLYESIGLLQKAAESLLEIIRRSSGDEDVDELLREISRMASEANDPTLLTRAYGAAATREDVSLSEKERHLHELARVLRDDLGDHDAAEAALHEIETLSTDLEPEEAEPEALEEPEAEADEPEEADEQDRTSSEEPDVPIEEPEEIATPLDEVAKHTWAEEMPVGSTDQLVEQMADEVDDVIQGEAGQLLARVVSGIEQMERFEEQQEEELDLPVLGEGQLGPEFVLEEGPVTERTALRTSLPEAQKSSSLQEVGLLLRCGELEEAHSRLFESLTLNAKPGPSAFVALGWAALDAGLGEDANVFFTRAITLLGPKDPRRWVAHRGLSHSYVALSEPRSAALSLVPTMESLEDETERAVVACEVAQQLLDAKERWLAAQWLEEALVYDPTSAAAIVMLVELYGALKDRAAVDRLAAQAEQITLEKMHLLSWLLALADARQELGDLEEAHDALLRALEVDPSDLRAPKALYHLGRRTKQDAWIDQALHEIRSRSFERGEMVGAFLSAAILEARGTANEGDRTVYATLRVDLKRTPRAPLPEEVISDFVDDTSTTAVLDHHLGELVTLDADLADVLEPPKTALAVTGIQLRELKEGNRLFEIHPGEIPRLGIQSHALKQEPKKRLRFEAARAVCALKAPALAEAYNAVDPSEEVLALDRIGLLFCGDPAVILPVLGPRSVRGEALTDFAISGELASLWAVTGLGIDAVAKERRRD